MAATAMPTSTARMRSKRTVVAAVTTRMNASPPVERSTARTLCRSTIRTAVTISTPASAANGMAPTGAPRNSTTTSSTKAWITDASRVRAPARTFTAVRAMAPVAGMPPNSGATTLASPWPNSSRSGSYRRPAAAMPSATLAESRLSSAARRATASDGGEQHPELGHVDGWQGGRRQRPGERADAAPRPGPACSPRWSRRSPR